MSRVNGNSAPTQDEPCIAVVGEIDDAGIAALADLLIAAARRQQHEDDGPETDPEEQDAL